MNIDDANATEGLPARLQRVGNELLELNQAIRSGEIDVRLLHGFREAVDHVRETAWAVQQWIELQAQDKDAYSVLPRLTVERIRRASQLNNDLALDLDAAEVTIETEGIENLRHSVRGLYKRLAQLA
jgi:hypothetical protein